MQQLYKVINDERSSQQVCALAMLVHSCYQVHQLAQGAAPSHLVINSYVQPILNLNPDNYTDLIYSLEILGQAMQTLEQLLLGQLVNPTSSQNPANLVLRQVVFYTHGALKLRTQLMKDPTKLTTLTNRIPIITRFQELQAAEQEDQNQSVVTKLAALYLDLFGQLDFRIIVKGTPDALRDSQRVEYIRCLLLGAIRFAVLWHQVGGRQWHFILQRGKIRAEVTRLKVLIAQAKTATAEVTLIKP